MSVHKPFIGTSPVVFVKWKCCAWTYIVLEVKCPAVQDILLLLIYQITFYTRQDGSLQLKDDHAHYYQCQLQLYTTQRLYCDFVVWTEQNLHMSASLYKDDTFLQTIIPQAKNLYKGSSLEVLLMNLKWGKIVEYA